MSRHAAPQSSKAGNIPFKPITHHRCTPMPATPIAEVRAAPARCMSTPRMDPREYAGMVSAAATSQSVSPMDPIEKKGSQSSELS